MDLENGIFGHKINWQEIHFYSKPFPEGSGVCPHTKNDKLITGYPSKSFTQYLSLLKGRKPNNFIYHHYVCSTCHLPTKFYVQFCWYCEKDFYGTEGMEQCLPCKTKSEG